MSTSLRPWPDVRTIQLPSEVGMPWLDDKRNVIVTFRGRCDRGCRWKYWGPAAREVLLDSTALQMLESIAMEYAREHVCLRK